MVSENFSQQYQHGGLNTGGLMTQNNKNTKFVFSYFTETIWTHDKFTPLRDVIFKQQCYIYMYEHSNL